MLRAGWGAREPSWMEARRSGGTADSTLSTRPRGGAVASSSPSSLGSQPRSPSAAQGALAFPPPPLSEGG